MLQIETSDPDTLPDAGLWPDWHLGDPVPRLGRYATIRLDGHELQMLIEAMRTARIVAGGGVYVGPDICTCEGIVCSCGVYSPD